MDGVGAATVGGSVSGKEVSETVGGLVPTVGPGVPGSVTTPTVGCNVVSATALVTAFEGVSVAGVLPVGRWVSVATVGGWVPRNVGRVVATSVLLPVTVGAKVGGKSVSASAVGENVVAMVGTGAPVAAKEEAADGPSVVSSQESAGADVGGRALDVGSGVDGIEVELVVTLVGTAVKGARVARVAAAVGIGAGAFVALLTRTEGAGVAMGTTGDESPPLGLTWSITTNTRATTPQQKTRQHPQAIKTFQQGGHREGGRSVAELGLGAVGCWFKPSSYTTMGSPVWFRFSTSSVGSSL